MMLTEAVFDQAAGLAGQLEERQSGLLEILCQAACASLTGRLREGLTPEDCQEAFVASAALLALAAFQEAGTSGSVEEFRAGDLTVKRSGTGAAADCLRQQAAMLIAPFAKDGFLFLGV